MGIVDTEAERPLRDRAGKAPQRKRLGPPWDHQIHRLVPVPVQKYGSYRDSSLSLVSI